LAEKEIKRLQNSTINVYSNTSDYPYAYDKGIIITNVKPLNYNIFLIIGLAMLGGFILNFMPCVFPILSLKVFSILKTVSYKPHKTKAALIISSLGIITTFIALGMLVNILKALGQEVFFGQNFQEPIFITFLCLSLLIFISSSQDRLNLKFPNIIVNKTTNIKFDNYYFEAFSSGVIASLLSTPCTAPFLGTAVSLALSGDAILVYLIFTSIGLGFALPYLLLAFSPSLLARLPKPGKWMDKIKKFLTLLLIGTLLWLLYIYCTQRGIYNSLGLAGLLLLIKFVIELRKGFIANKVPKLVIFCLLSFLLFYLPQFSYTREVILHRNTAKTWQNIDLQEIPRLIDEGKIVVVDVTADWCVTCKFNKLTVLNLQKTLDLLSDKNIIAIRADFTNYSSDILFFLKTHEVHGVPFNIVYSKAAPAGIILPTLLNYKDLIEAIEKARVK
jgi:suppressor for copper-sensitivity B